MKTSEPESENFNLDVRCKAAGLAIMSGAVEDAIDRFELSPEFVSVMAGTKPARVLGLDIGTSGVRAALFDEHGREINGAGVRIQRSVSALDDFAAMDADATVRLVVETIDALLAQPNHSFDQIELIACACFWHSLVGVDAAGAATTPVLGWAQTRAARAARELRNRFDEGEIHSRTGCRFHPSYWPAKLLQLRDEQPEAFNATRLWLSFSEYLTLNLFGETTTSISMASGTGLFNQRECKWDEELLSALDIHHESLPRIAGANQSMHKLALDYSLRWPQLSEARFYPAIGDGAANSIGSGCTTRELLALMIGTSGAMRMLYEGEPPTSLPPELWCYRADRTRVLLGGALSDGGGLFGWIREAFLSNQDLKSIENALGELEPDAHGLTVLPFWSGERSTGWSAEARGAIVGLTLKTRPIEILRASMEAIAYRFTLIAKALAPLAPDASIVVSGNALRSSPLWNQIIADVLGRPLVLSDVSEASTRGAALLALAAAGKIQSLDDFTVPIADHFEPDMSRHNRYQEGLARQQRVYERLMLDDYYETIQEIT